MQATESLDLVCFSHVRWDASYGRPQQLLSLAAREQRVFFIEQPAMDAEDMYYLELRHVGGGIIVAVPHLSPDLSELAQTLAQKQLLDELMEDYQIDDFLLWYYTPQALRFSRHLNANILVYDRLDTVSDLVKGSEELSALDDELQTLTDLMLTGGGSLHEAQTSTLESLEQTFLSIRRQLDEACEPRSMPSRKLVFTRPSFPLTRASGAVYPMSAVSV